MRTATGGARRGERQERVEERSPQVLPGSNHGTLRMLYPIISRRNRRALWVGASMAVLSQGTLAVIPLIQKVIIDDSITSKQRSLTLWVGIMVTLGLVSFITAYLRRRIGGVGSVQVQRDLQVAIHHHLQYLDASRRDELRVGDIMSRATSDLTLIQMYLQDLGIAFGNVTLPVISVIIMVLLSPLLALVMVVSIPTFFLIAAQFRARTFPASWMDQRFQGTVAGVVEEAVTGVRVVKAFGQEAQEQQALNGEARNLFQSRLRTARIIAVFMANLDAIPGLTQIAVLALGGWLAMHHRLTLGVFVAFSSYVLQLVAPVRFLSGLMTTSQQARAGAARVVELLAMRSIVVEPGDARVLSKPIGLVEFDHVDFGYPGGEMVLHDITLRIEPGERLAIVGASGSGKTTLALLLARFHDATAGTVKVDGRDVSSYTLASLRSAVGMVFEEGFLFSTTIRDNIAFGRPDASMEEVEQAARVAHAHGFISGLPEGYDTVVGERGFTLSGGQRQRIALARCALTNPKVLILDDATSAIDARTESGIYAALDEVLVHRTMVLIAHRHSTLSMADRVIVMDRGRIVDEGTTEELLATSLLFRELLTGPEASCIDSPMGDPPPADATVLDRGAWPTDVSRAGAPKMSIYTSEAATRAASGSNGPGLTGDTRAVAGLAGVSPRLLKAVDALPPLRGEPDIDLEEAMSAHQNFSMAAVFRPFRLPLLVSGLMVVIDTLSGLATPVLVSFGVNRGVLAGSRRTLMVTSLILLLLQLVIWTNSRVMMFYTQRTAERVLFGLRVRTFAHLQRLSLNYYDQHMGGDVMTRMTSDVEALAQLLQQGLLAAMVSLLSCGGIAIALVAFDPSLVLSVAVIFPALVVSTVWFRRASGRTYLQARDRIAVVYANMQESLAGVTVSQAYNQQPANEARFAVLADSYCQTRSHSIELIARFFPFLQLMNVIAKAITLIAGAHLIADGSLSVGVLVAFLLYLDQFFTPIQQLSMVFDQWLQAKVAVVRLGELLRTPTATPADAHPIVPGPLAGTVTLDHVTFAYESTGLVAMRDVTIRIPAGQVVALVGTTGAGKSTLVKLVARFYDATSGTVTIDGIPLKTMDLAAYRHQLGYVPQEPFLFSGTIRSNIAYGRPDAADLAVERAARAVGAHQFIAELPHGYHSPVSEQGRSLSAGQRQLLSLARALLVDPAILVLDEATANLDLATEARVQKAMSLVASGRTTLVIAHRLQTARAAERILVVDDGTITEDGSHDELIALGGQYAALWSAMTSSALDGSF